VCAHACVHEWVLSLNKTPIQNYILMSACRVAVNEFSVNDNKTSKLSYGYDDPLHGQRYESQSSTI